MAQFEPDSWNPAIAVITWLLMSITALAVASRLLTKYLLAGGLMADDALIMISFVFGIGNNIAIFVATAHGFGNHTGTIIATMKDIVTKAAWVVFLATANGITDIVIFAQAMVLIVHVQATWKKKAVFASIFLPRLLVVASSIVEIILTKANTSSTDPFINASPTTIYMEITQSLSIITACWGQLKPFMVRLRSNAFCLQNNEWTNPAYNGRPQPSHVSCTTRGILSESGGDIVLSSTYGTKTKASTSRASGEWESQSQSSETYIIQEAREWTVDLPTAAVVPMTASKSGGMGK
ncbi:hypothetical protein BDV41DRAFT_572569 [Aspergillus transmontanensis]|uniref:Rhodopsin domain-containing protein n=1 Tax=Aspergillus transmontanensis TaxID=1034304 RepID=A0A5N6WD05_9EURO|nr:hypothetical protein BDV41DRAFT_572569 [Aspergillus transmontanensis]